jgi:hypothetical protein
VRTLVRIAGWLAIVIAIATIGLMLAARLGGENPVQAIGQLWFAVDSGSLNALQAAVERYLAAPLWDYIIFPVLRLQATLVALIALVAGLVLLLLSRRRGERRRRMFKS